jgi:anaerobic dimethyl sulfoxide reductase subunit B (iron-sulfur subunit)
MGVRGWVFSVDVARCTGCQACRVACNDRVGLGGGPDLLRVEREEGGAYPTPQLAYRVVHCFHCAEPPCAPACPVEALVVADDGRVALRAEACVGCGACVEACPFDAVVLGPGAVAVKCDGCADEVARGWAPTCVRACPLRALAFGPPGRVPPSRRVEGAGFADHEAQPRVRYLRWRD